ncbi:oxidoreductase [Rhodohalobacter mucosus]|nr:oxidoreductase [Rhodohalobacter mucosus]
MKESVIRAGILGFGKSGRNIHAPLIDACRSMVLKNVVTRTGPEQIPGRNEVNVMRSAEELIRSEDTDLIVITTPNHLHYKMAHDALTAGKHVVVDKPFTVTAEQAHSLTRTAEKSGKVLTVFHNRRWDGDFLTVRNLISRQAVGRLVEFESRFDRFRNYLKEDAWKEKDLPGSGILYDLSPHLIDQALQVFGVPNKLFADIRNQRWGEADDFFMIRFYYDDFTATLRAGMLVADATPRFVIRGTMGSYVKYGFDPQEEALARGDDPHGAEWGHEPENKFGVLRTADGDSFREERIPTAGGGYPQFYRNIADAVNGKVDLQVKPAEAAEVIRMIELALKSQKSGTVVDC